MKNKAEEILGYKGLFEPGDKINIFDPTTEFTTTYKVVFIEHDPELDEIDFIYYMSEEDDSLNDKTSTVYNGRYAGIVTSDRTDLIVLHN